MPDSADDAARGREAVGKARSVVIKIGSRALSTEREIYDRLAQGVAEAHAAKRSVVLVDDGDDFRLEQRGERLARVADARAIGEIGVGQEDLRHGEIAAAECFFVEPHEHALPRRGGRLE